MQYEHIYVIGDIHGQYYKLQSLLEKFELKDNDLMIFLGDYIDRGDYCLKCLDFIMDFSQKENVIALKGNHERMMEMYFHTHDMEGNTFDGPDGEKPSDSKYWVSHNGGRKTFEDLTLYYKKHGSIEKYLKYIENMPVVTKLAITGKTKNINLCFSHSGVDPKVPEEMLEQDDYLWNRIDFLFNYKGNDLWYVGHTPVQYIAENLEMKNPKPEFLSNNITMLDTGSFLKNGKISCLEIIHSTIYQSY